MRKWILLAIFLIPLPAFAEGYTKTNTFSASTTASAAEVNANFDEISTAVNDNAADIDTLQADSHAEAHTVASHSDTTATGTETETLTDGSNADSLHIHGTAGVSGLVDADITFTAPALGTPSAVVLTNATGTAAGLTAGAATALAANPSNCSAGSAPRGVAASGAAEDCTDYLEPTDVPNVTVGDTVCASLTTCTQGSIHFDTTPSGTVTPCYCVAADTWEPGT